MARVTTQLEAFLDELGEPAGSDADLRAYARALLMAHLIWSFYGSKLAQREVDWFGKYLVCADELAWECYRPARDAAEDAGTVPVGELREPPLVFLNNQATPFVQPRETAFRVEGITMRDVESLSRALFLLPVPILSALDLRPLPAPGGDDRPQCGTYRGGRL